MIPLTRDAERTMTGFWPGFDREYVPVADVSFREIIVAGSFGELTEEEIRSRIFEGEEGFFVETDSWELAEGELPLRKIEVARVIDGSEDPRKGDRYHE